MAIREGRWDCPSCGSRGQLGRNVECAGCGAPRPQGIRFYLPGDEPPVTDSAQLAQARAGADWVCEHCGGSARATERECPGCGAPRGGSAAQPVRDLDTDQVPHSSEDAERAAAADRAAERASRAAKKPAQPATAKDFLILGCTGCGGLGCLGLLFLLLLGMCSTFGKSSGTPANPDSVRAAVSARDSTPREFYNPYTRVVVADRRWTRSVQVEELGRVVESGQSVPEDAEVLGSSREVTGHRRVFDHDETHTRQRTERVRTGSEEYVCGQRDLGNGYFEDKMCSRPVYETRTRTEEESEPVYRDDPEYGTVYRYAVWRWLPDTTLTAVSRDGTPPRWPSVRRRRSRRAGEREERLEVELRNFERGTVYTAEVDTAVYRRLLVGDTVRVVIEDGTVKHVLPIFRGTPRGTAADTARPDTASADTAEKTPPRRTERPSRTRRGSSRRRASRG